MIRSPFVLYFLKNNSKEVFCQLFREIVYFVSGRKCLAIGAIFMKFGLAPAIRNIFI